MRSFRLIGKLTMPTFYDLSFRAVAADLSPLSVKFDDRIISSVDSPRSLRLGLMEEDIEETEGHDAYHEEKPEEVEGTHNGEEDGEWRSPGIFYPSGVIPVVDLMTKGRSSAQW